MRARRTCRACGSSHLRDIFHLGNFYLSEFRADNKKSRKYPLHLVLCKKCNLLQLKHSVLRKLLFNEGYGYKSGVNKSMRAELDDIAKKAIKLLKSQSGSIVVDIGANDGTFLSFFPKDFVRVWIEPVGKFQKEARFHTDYLINDFFSLEAYRKSIGKRKAQIIAAISCFYDVSDLNVFVSGIAKILDPNGILIIQQNYLPMMLKNNAFDNIVHEHLTYFSLTTLATLLGRHGLEIFDVELRSVNGGSFRTYIARKGKRRVLNSVALLMSQEKKLHLGSEKIYKDFYLKIKKERKRVLNFLKQLVRRGRTVYLYGASTRGNTLLQFYGLDKKLIKKAVERNSEKWGKKIASVGIPIISEGEARKEKPDYMLVLPWFFRDEFIKREKKYLQKGGKFIFPLPKFDVFK